MDSRPAGPPGLADALARSLAALRDWPWRNTLHTLRLRLREDRLALTASSLTFTTVISLVPLLTVMLALFTAFPIFGRFQTALQQYFLQALVPDSIARPVLRALTQFAAQASKLGGVGLLVLGLSALALVFTIDRTLNNIWRVRRPRPLARRVLLYWAAITLGPLLLGASLSATSYALSASRGLVSALPGGVALVLDLLEFGLQLAAVALLFRYVPNTHVRWAHALGGALFVAVGLDLAKRVLAWYLGAVPALSMVYGAFATVPIFLLWIHLSWLILLLGAVVAAYAPSLSARVQRRPDRPGEGFALALEVLRALAAARQAGTGGATVEALASRLRADPLQLEPVLEALATLGWCGRLDEEGAKRHVLLVDPAATPAQPLADALLLADPAASAALRRAGALHQARLAQLLG